MPLKKSQKSLKKWTKQKWRTKSGKPSTQGKKATGERYLPEKAIKSLSSKEYAATPFFVLWLGVLFGLFKPERPTFLSLFFSASVKLICGASLFSWQPS